MARWYFAVIARSLKKTRSFTVGLTLLLVALFCVGQASAADKFTYTVDIRPATYSGTVAGDFTVKGLDTLKTTTIRVTAGGVPAAPLNYAAGPALQSASGYAFTGGDTIKVEQPTGTTLETFTIPNLSLAGTVGSPTLNGHAPDGTVTLAQFDDICQGLVNDDFAVQPQGGAFTVVYPKPLVAGSFLTLRNYPGKGDLVNFYDRVPGETPCFSANADLFPTQPGDTPDPAPYVLNVSSFRNTVATGARVVLRRGGAILVDNTNAATTTGLYIQTAVQPLPGDVVELYRPHTAGAPTSTFTIPNVRAVYDPGNSLVAIDAPAASYVSTGAGLLHAMFTSDRIAQNTQPGRTLFDFASVQGYEKPFDLAHADFIYTQWNSQDGTRSYEVDTVPGDLTPPTISVKLAPKFKLAKLGSSISANVTSSEPVTAKLTLTLPAKLKTAAAKSKSPRVIATAKVSIRAGVTKVKIKFTKSGKKLIKTMRKGHYPANKAALTVLATDFSGNAASTVKSTKLASK